MSKKRTFPLEKGGSQIFFDIKKQDEKKSRRPCRREKDVSSRVLAQKMDFVWVLALSCSKIWGGLPRFLHVFENPIFGVDGRVDEKITKKRVFVPPQKIETYIHNGGSPFFWCFSEFYLCEREFSKYFSGEINYLTGKQKMLHDLDAVRIRNQTF